MDFYSAAEFKKAMDTIEQIYFRSYRSQKSPKAYLVCGQPGAGKSYLVSRLKQKDFAFINGDEFRWFHPHIDDLRESLGEKYMEATRSFNGKMTEALIDDLSDRRINLIIEGTLRTIEVPIKTKNLLEKKGYEVELCIFVVRPELSFLRAKKRYYEMKNLGTIPRATDTNFQKDITDGLVANLETIYERREFKEIKLFGDVNNEIALLYSLQKSPDVNSAQLLYDEHHKLYSEEEIGKLKKQYEDVIELDTFNKLFTGKIESE